MDRRRSSTSSPNPNGYDSRSTTCVWAEDKGRSSSSGRTPSSGTTAPHSSSNPRTSSGGGTPPSGNGTPREFLGERPSLITTAPHSNMHGRKLSGVGTPSGNGTPPSGNGIPREFARRLSLMDRRCSSASSPNPDGYDPRSAPGGIRRTSSAGTIQRAGSDGSTGSKGANICVKKLSDGGTPSGNSTPRDFGGTPLPLNRRRSSVSSSNPDGYASSRAACGIPRNSSAGVIQTQGNSCVKSFRSGRTASADVHKLANYIKKDGAGFVARHFGTDDDALGGWRKRGTVFLRVQRLRHMTAAARQRSKTACVLRKRKRRPSLYRRE